MKILNQRDLLEILPFGRTKCWELIRNGVIPTVKVGQDYIITEEKLKEWVDKNIGKRVY